jgi:putative toxin-antitoxin system antitoxin component (TIGR02293 family)
VGQQKSDEQVKADIADLAERARALSEKVKERLDETYHELARTVRRAKAPAGGEVEEWQETASSLSRQSDLFEQMLGINARSEQEILHLIENQLPLETFYHLVQQGVSITEAYSLIINPRTLKHRRSKKQPLSVEESERVVRVARILATAQAVLGERESALNWLRTPKKRFDGRTPMEMIATEVGGRMVEEMLIQIDEGMFA